MLTVGPFDTLSLLGVINGLVVDFIIEEVAVSWRRKIGEKDAFVEAFNTILDSV